MQAKQISISLRQAAIIAGLGLLIMTIVAPIAEMTRQGLMVAGDDSMTLDNIRNNAQSIRMITFIFLIVAILDLVVAWALYLFFKPVGKSLSLLGGWFRMGYAVILAFISTNLMNAVILVDAGQVDFRLIQYFRAFDLGWMVGLVFFGIHLLIIGYLALRSDYVPKVLAILLLITPAGYFIDSFGKILSSGYDANYAMITFIGEPLFMFWLLYKGYRGDLDQTQK